MKNERLAAIDIGTNSIRCIVVEASRSGSYRILDDEKETVRLGEGIASRGPSATPQSSGPSRRSPAWPSWSRAWAFRE